MYVPSALGLTAIITDKHAYLAQQGSENFWRYHCFAVPLGKGTDAKSLGADSGAKPKKGNKVIKRSLEYLLVCLLMWCAVCSAALALAAWPSYILMTLEARETMRETAAPMVFLCALIMKESNTLAAARRNLHQRQDVQRHQLPYHPAQGLSASGHRRGWVEHGIRSVRFSASRLTQPDRDQERTVLRAVAGTGTVFWHATWTRRRWNDTGGVWAALLAPRLPARYRLSKVPWSLLCIR